MLEDDLDKKSEQNAMYAWNLMERYTPEIVSCTKSDDRRFVHLSRETQGIGPSSYGIYQTNPRRPRIHQYSARQPLYFRTEN